MIEKMTIEKREAELAAYLSQQPYVTELDGIHLQIDKNVFPSDFGITSSFFGNFMLQQQPVENALDMGCGSGYFALLMKKLGCDNVLGVDFNKDAVACAQNNVSRNSEWGPIEIIHSDLFSEVPVSQFDAVVFNFNYYPANGNFGLNADGGREILKRFFSQVGNYLRPQAPIYIPYSSFIGPEHDPKHVCVDYGFTAEIVATTLTHTGEHVIYKIQQT